MREASKNRSRKKFPRSMYGLTKFRMAINKDSRADFSQNGPVLLYFYANSEADTEDL